jgi:hypothetical protein
LLILVAATGCGITFTEKTVAVVEENVTAWHRVSEFVRGNGLADDVVLAGKTHAQWVKYVRGALANALVLQAKARGEKITFVEALNIAKEETP